MMRNTEEGDNEEMSFKSLPDQYQVYFLLRYAKACDTRNDILNHAFDNLKGQVRPLREAIHLLKKEIKDLKEKHQKDLTEAKEKVKDNFRNKYNDLNLRHANLLASHEELKRNNGNSTKKKRRLFRAMLVDDYLKMKGLTDNFGVYAKERSENEFKEFMDKNL